MHAKIIHVLRLRKLFLSLKCSTHPYHRITCKPEILVHLGGTINHALCCAGNVIMLARSVVMLRVMPISMRPQRNWLGV